MTLGLIVLPWDKKYQEVTGFSKITATPAALGMNGGGACDSKSDRSARSMIYFFPLRIAANPTRFRR